MKRRRTKLHFWCEKCKKFTLVDYEYNGIVTEDGINDEIEEVEWSPYELRNFYSDLLNKREYLTCKYCKSNVIYIDTLIANSIEKLASIGIKTKYCCSGHQEKDRISITLELSDVLVDNFDLLFNSFKDTLIEFPEFNKCCPTIEYVPATAINQVIISGTIHSTDSTHNKYIYSKKFTFEEIRDEQDKIVKTCNKYFTRVIDKFVQEMLSRKMFNSLENRQ